MLIKTPKQYVNQPDILRSAGSYVAKIGRKAFVVGGKTALAAAGQEFFHSLKAAEIEAVSEEFFGYCTQKAVDQYAETVKRIKADVIIGVGGGKALDLAKAIGDQLAIPVITVPTIAATCAAWSALSILYDEKGRFAGGMILKNSPQLVLVDSGIIARAPERYLRAGIADTLAKWYETAPYVVQAENDLVLQLGLENAKLAFRIIEEKGIRAIKDAADHYESEILREVIDSIIVLAGLVGSISEGANRPALGHAIHNTLTFIPETHSSLHGEKVIFGVLAQLLLEGKTPTKITDFIRWMNELGLPVTLGQLGILDPQNAAAEVGMNIDTEAFTKYPFPVTPQLIEKVMIEADRLGEGTLNQSLNKGGIHDERNILAV